PPGQRHGRDHGRPQIECPVVRSEGLLTRRRSHPSKQLRVPHPSPLGNHPYGTVPPSPPCRGARRNGEEFGPGLRNPCQSGGEWHTQRPRDIRPAALLEGEDRTPDDTLVTQ